MERFSSVGREKPDSGPEAGRGDWNENLPCMHQSWCCAPKLLEHNTGSLVSGDSVIAAWQNPDRMAESSTLITFTFYYIFQILYIKWFFGKGGQIWCGYIYIYITDSTRITRHTSTRLLSYCQKPRLEGAQFHLANTACCHREVQGVHTPSTWTPGNFVPLAAKALDTQPGVPSRGAPGQNYVGWRWPRLESS